MPAVLAFNATEIVDRFGAVAADLGIAGGFKGFCKFVGEFNDSLGIPRTLSALGVTVDAIPDSGNSALSNPSCGRQSCQTDQGKPGVAVRGCPVTRRRAPHSNDDQIAISGEQRIGEAVHFVNRAVRTKISVCNRLQNSKCPCVANVCGSVMTRFRRLSVSIPAEFLPAVTGHIMLGSSALKYRFFDAAAIDCMGTTCLELTARRRVGR